MKFRGGLALFLLAGSSMFAANVTAPLQPSTGPGGSDYPYTSVQIGPFTVPGHKPGGGWDYFVFSPAGMIPSPGNPNPLPTPASAPTILFIHGFDGNTPEPYLFWMSHMAKMGFNVIWPEFDSTSNRGLNGFLTVIADAFNDAIVQLGSPGRVAPLLDSSSRPVYTVAGHSLGGYLALGLAAGYQLYSMPSPLAVIAVEPGEGNVGSINAANVNPATLIEIIIGDQDTQDRLCGSITAWEGLPTSPIFKPFLLVRTDQYGTPAQVGNHWFPLTETLKDTVRPYSVDDRDYNVTWKISVAASSCMITGEYCDYALGNGPPNAYGATTQTDMGLWSDGVPVTPMLLVTDPQTYFAGTCGTS